MSDPIRDALHTLLNTVSAERLGGAASMPVEVALDGSTDENTQQTENIEQAQSMREESEGVLKVLHQM